MRDRRGERGMAVPWALLLLIVASGLTAILLERGRGLSAATQHEREDLRAFFAAEGALAYTRHLLASDASFPGETIRVGECDVEISVAQTERGHWTVTAVTRPGSVRIEAVYRRAAGLPELVSWRRR